MRVKIKVQPSGCLNGNLWPEPGGEVDLPDDTAQAMAAAGWVELVKAEKPKVEKRPAPRKGTETRKD